MTPRPTHTFTCSCVHYSCEAIDCQEPLIRNAELKCSSPGRHFYNGDRCTISCNSGYVLQIHQDDDIIKSQVNTLLHTFTQSSLYKEEHGCIHIHRQTLNIKRHFYSIWKRACKHEFVNAHMKLHWCKLKYTNSHKQETQKRKEKKRSLFSLGSFLYLYIYFVTCKN